MYHDCQCVVRRIAEIKGAFLNKKTTVINSLKQVEKFFEQVANIGNESGELLQKVGVPSGSFMTKETHSMLFDSEDTVFEGEMVGTKILFAQIRGRYQSLGKCMVSKAGQWLEKAQVGDLKQIERKIEDLGQEFEEQF